MANVSKSGLPRKQPHLSRTGKQRIFACSESKLLEMREKAQRPRDKDKIDNRLKVLKSRSGLKQVDINLTL